MTVPPGPSAGPAGPASPAPGVQSADTELDSLLGLLPAFYRLRDVEQGGALRALLAVIQAEFDRVDAETARSYDNWFIETCEEWVVPYLGDLLGVRGLPPPPATDGAAAHSQRAYVANTLAYRRSKGTARVLEQLARDVTGFGARAVEFWQLLAVTQHVNHVRSGHAATVSMRGAEALERLGTAFEQPAARTFDARHADNGRGRYNLPHVGIFLWRQQSYAVTRAAPRPAGIPGGEGLYTFHPAGVSAPLFNRPRTLESAGPTARQRVGEANLPGRLRRRALADELGAPAEAANAADADFLDPAGPPAFSVLIAETPQQLVPEPVPRDRLAICNLESLPDGTWRRPPAGKTVAVDPVLGRLSLPPGVRPARIQVSYGYGYAGDIGGGPYDRTASVARWLDPSARPVTWQAGVTQDLDVLPTSTPQAPLFRTLGAAVLAWRAHAATHPDAFGVIAILDSSTYPDAPGGPDGLTGTHALVAPAATRLAVVAADWPRFDEPGMPPSLLGRRIGELVPDGVRPHLRGGIEVGGSGEVILDGLLVEGRLTVVPGDLAALTVQHCTLAPAAGGLHVQVGGGQETNSRLRLTLFRTVSGPVTAAGAIGRVEISASVLDPGSDPPAAAEALRVPAADLTNATVFGRSTMHELNASNTIFGGTVTVARQQLGCVRFSYLPPGSRTPRQYRCQPGAGTADRVVPVWSSNRWGDPGYAQLHPSCPSELAQGADDGDEMGVFHFVGQARRIAALRQALDEYLRFGMEAGVFLVE